MSKTLSPAQAAQAANVSRWTIVRAIKSTDLKAIRNNQNHWKIDTDDLDRWCNKRMVNTERAHLDAPQNIAEQIRLAELETENRMLKDQVIDLKADRDAWRKQAEQVSEPFWRVWFR